MNKFYTLVTVLFFAMQSISYAQISIADARAMSEGTEVTVEGIVTNGFELGIIRYMQDGTAGIAVYPGSGSVGDFPDDVKRGDMIRVRGTLKTFNELLEIDPVLEYEVISSGNALPAALEVSPAEIDESLEGQLVVINDAAFEDGGSVFGVGNYTFTSNGESSEIYVRSGHPLLGQTIPLAGIQLTGIVSQFNSIYQVLPRDEDDIQIVDNFFITSFPAQSEITQSGFDISWTTNANSNSIIRYGINDVSENEMIVTESVSDHEVTLDMLAPGEFYYVQVASDNGSSVVESPVAYFATASQSSGTTHVYFNHSVDATVSDGNYPSTTKSGDLEEALIGYIDAAETSIDIAMYNTNRVQLIEALTRAFTRGVQVRFVTDNETANLALGDPVPPFTIIRGNSDGLMHNKFLVIDANSTDNSWLIAGSLNFTEQNMANDFNNMIAIQDQSLCKAYEIEFEEMWGAEGAVPGIFNVKFGAEKINNTPHLFSVGGVMIESYFSPSDNTTAEIASELEAADNDVSFALLTFTNNTLGTAVLDAHNRGVDVRGIIDNINDTGSEYTYLSDLGVMVTPDFTTRQTHHKYCLVDAADTGADPVVITGSHNWSASAETRNDENTLIIHSAAVSNIFLQEFEARWCESTGSGNCVTSNQNIVDSDALKVYPNPASDFINIDFQDELSGQTVIQLWNTDGRLLMSSVLNIAGNNDTNINISHLDSGNYYLHVLNGEERMVKRFIKL